MNVGRLIAVCSAVLLACSAAARGGAQARAELLADVAAVRPGKPFTLAVRLAIEPGWHVYWLESGNGGLPTRVSLALPDGFTAGEVRYPVPVQFRQPGNLVGYGYERGAAFLADVTPPADWPTGHDVTVTATVSWLACSDKLCEPGKQTVTLTLPTAAEAKPANVEQFRGWRERLPVPNMMESNVLWPITLEPGKVRFDFRADAPPDAKEAQVFVAAGKTVDVTDTRFGNQLGDTVAVSFVAELLRNQKPPERILAVVGYTDAEGVRRGTQIESTSPTELARAFAGR